jgi:hypothetical protein
VLGEDRESRPPHLGHAGSVQVGRERVDRPVPVVARADQGCRPVAVEPGRRQVHPALCHVVAEPGVVGAGGEPDLVELVVAASPGKTSQMRQLGPEPGLVLVDLQCRGGQAQVSHAQPAGPQHCRWVHAPLVQQVLDPAHRLVRGAGGGALHGCCLPTHRLGRRWPVGTGRGEAPASQMQCHLSRQQHRASVDSYQQAERQQVLDRALSVGAAQLAAHAAQAARGRTPGEPCQYVRGAGVGLLCCFQQGGEVACNQVGHLFDLPAASISSRGAHGGGHVAGDAAQPAGGH